MGSTIKAVNDVVSEIAYAGNEQASGIKQVSSAIMQMDEVTQQNASIVEEISSTSEHLSGEAAFLLKTVSQFKTW